MEVRILDREAEDRGIRSEHGHWELIDVLARRPTRQQLSRDVGKPEALTKVVERSRRVHTFTVGEALSKWRQKQLAHNRLW